MNRKSILCIGALALAASFVSAPAFSATRAEMRVIDRVHREVGRQIQYEADLPGEGMTIEPTRGDCEDYAATKMHRLLALGFAPERMVIMVVLTERNEPHAVLVIDGEVVLDNRYDGRSETRAFLTRHGYSLWSPL